MSEMTEKQAQEQYAKLKKIDEYAKSLGMTIYRVDYGFEKVCRVRCFAPRKKELR